MVRYYAFLFLFLSKGVHSFLASNQNPCFTATSNVDYSSKNSCNHDTLSDDDESLPDDTTFAGPIAICATMVWTAAPLIACAIDHPVDHDILNIPIPVPDFRYFISGGLCAATSHGITTPIDVVKVGYKNRM